MFRIVGRECHYFYLAILYTFALIVVFMRPLDVQAWQWADEALYFNNAKAILSNQLGGHWLGEFNNIVLAKAPFFSVFLAFSHSLGIPLRLAEFLLFCPIPFLLFIAVRPLRLPKWPVLYIATSCLILIPAIGGGVRLLREVVFGAMSLYCLTALCGLILACWFGKRGQWLWGSIAGLTMGIAGITREEAAWMMLPAGLTAIACIHLGWRFGKLRNVLASILIMMAGYFVPVTTISILNYNSYGIYATSLRQHADFRQLYSVLVSLEPAERLKYVPIVTPTRLKAYSLSEHFAKLEPYLEGEAMDPIALSRAHFYLNGWGEREGREFFVSNFEFALTDAIFMSGVSTGDGFLEFCRKVTNELVVAIERGEIEQGPTGIMLFPPLTSSDYIGILSASFKSVKYLLMGEGVQRAYSIESTTDPKTEIEWHSFLMTWPSFSLLQERKFSDFVFNHILVSLFKCVYIPILILGALSQLYLFRTKESDFGILLLMILVALSALGSFNGTMGIVHSIAWPVLNWPNGYNVMGYYPLHFLLLTLLISLLKSVVSFSAGWDNANN